MILFLHSLPSPPPIHFSSSPPHALFYFATPPLICFLYSVFRLDRPTFHSAYRRWTVWCEYVSTHAELHLLGGTRVESAPVFLVLPTWGRQSTRALWRGVCCDTRGGEGVGQWDTYCHLDILSRTLFLTKSCWQLSAVYLDLLNSRISIINKYRYGNKKIPGKKI